jgi:hypothetical protein
MGWEALIPIIAEYGIPLAESLFKKWSTGTPPIQADFDELRALANQNATDHIKAQLAKAGIPLTDPKAVALLALTQ